ncbi:MAG TPA: DUF418 domain-containing protein [Streptosporangiaceae bacterium]
MWLGLVLEQRFFPVFATLFGVGFGLLMESVAARGGRARVVLARRLGILLAIGLAHMFLLWRGDVLSTYAVAGLVVLLPSTWLPRWALPAAAAALGGAALFLLPGGYSLSPALFLVGAALVRYGVVDRLEARGAGTAVTLVVLAALAVPASVAQAGMASSAYLSGVLSAATGVLVAGVYACGIVLLYRTPVRRVLRAVFAPLGRMALTNYLSASALVLTLAHLDGRPQDWSWGTVFGIAGGVLAVQWAWSALWLRRFRQGPVEWLWRWGTWATRPPFRV